MIQRKFKIKNIFSINKKAALFLLAAVLGVGISFWSRTNTAKADYAQGTLQITSLNPSPIVDGQEFKINAQFNYSGTPQVPLSQLKTMNVYVCTYQDATAKKLGDCRKANQNTERSPQFFQSIVYPNFPSTATNSGSFNFDVTDNTIGGFPYIVLEIFGTATSGYTNNGGYGANAGLNGSAMQTTYTAISAPFSVANAVQADPNSVNIGVQLVNGVTEYKVDALVGGHVQGNQPGAFYTYRWTFTINGQPLNFNPGDVNSFTQNFNFKDSQGNIGDYVIKLHVFNNSVSVGTATYPLKVATSAAVAQVTPPASAADGSNPILTFLKDIIGGLVFFLSTVLYEIIRLIFTPLIMTVLSIAPHTPSFSAVILTVWVFVRNVVNILFILALIALGLATLLRVDNDHLNYKHLIPNLVMMAILVNFSLVIAQLILGVADTVQAQFLPNNADVINNLARELLLQPVINNFSGVLSPGTWTEIISSIIYMLFGMGAFIAFGLIAAFLVLRIVGLWLLLMLSPVAYAANVLPWTHDIAHEWWHRFLAYSFFTPILAFFLHACAVLVVAQSSFIGSVTQSAVSVSSAQNHAQFIYNILSGTLVLICLYAGLMVSQKFHVAGAHWVVEKVEKGVHAGAHMVGAEALRWKNENITNKLLEAGRARQGTLAGRILNAAGSATALGATWKARQARVHHKQERTATETAGLLAQASEYRATHGAVDNRSDVKALEAEARKNAEAFLNDDVGQSARGIAALAHTLEHHPEEAYLMEARIMALFKNKRLKDVASDLIQKYGIDPNGELNGTNYSKLMDKLMGTGSRAQKFKAMVMSQEGKNLNYYWATYPAKEVNGKFVSGHTDIKSVLEKPEEDGGDPSKIRLMNNFAPVKSDGSIDTGYGVNAVQYENVDRAKTSEPNELMSPDALKPDYIEPGQAADHKKHYHPSYLFQLSRLGESSAQELLRLQPSEFRKMFKVKGIDKATGAWIFENKEAAEMFERDMTEVAKDSSGNPVPDQNDKPVRVVRKGLERLVAIGSNAMNGIGRVQETTQDGVGYMYEGDNKLEYKHVFRSYEQGQDVSKIHYAPGADKGIEDYIKPGAREITWTNNAEREQAINNRVVAAGSQADVPYTSEIASKLKGKEGDNASTNHRTRT